MHDLTLSNSLADLAARIRVEHEATAAALTNSIDHAIAAGELLIEAKSQVQHGQWLPWIAEHCEMSDRTVRLYMRLANHKDALAAKSATVADIGIRGGNALLMQLRDDARRDAFHAPVPVRETPNPERRPYVRVAPEDNEEVTPYGARHFLETWRGSTRGDRRSFVTSVWDELRELKSTSSDCSRSGVSQVSTGPEKLSSGLPTGSDSPKTPQSWTVVAVAEDGKRYGSGARFRTKEEARAYMAHAHRPLWEYAINEVRIAPSQDNPNCGMDRFDKGRDKGKVRPVCRVIFEHGTCGNLVWGEIDADGNVVWDESSACEDSSCDDGLDIPDNLKRVVS